MYELPIVNQAASLDRSALLTAALSFFVPSVGLLRRHFQKSSKDKPGKPSTYCSPLRIVGKSHVHSHEEGREDSAG